MIVVVVCVIVLLFATVEVCAQTEQFDSAAVPSPICSMNGKLNATLQCNCYQGWTGVKCHKLSFKPFDGTKGSFVPAYGYRPNVTSWGGNAFVDGNGTWHLFVSEMYGGCHLSKWMSHSMITHATASSPLGPFKKSDIALPVFAHNASPLKVGDWWYIFHIGSASNTPPISNCTSSLPLRSRHNRFSADESTASPTGDGSVSTTTTSSFAHRSKSPYGPWSPLPSISCNNPAPMVHSNGTMYCICSSGSHAPFYRTDDPTSGWTSLGSLSWPEDWQSSDGYLKVEDPFLYVDARGVWHMLCHRYDYRNGYPPNPNMTEPMLVSGHAWSSDGFSWVFEDEAPFEAVAHFSDGTYRNYSTYERPHLIFDARGEPTHLVSAVSPTWLGPDGHACSQCDARPGSEHSCVVCKTSVGVDYTYTLITSLVPSE
eukprot:m.116254 g.116254  ORF g.116254 m.116254 type:complete len:427 (-) comp12849_c0_seq1:2817-4097(-)